MSISIKVKASLLADYVIICVATSAIILGWSYMGLTLTTKPIPSELTTLAGSLAASAITAAALKGRSELNLNEKGSVVNTCFVGLATTTLALVIHYNMLIWNERSIPKELSPTIGILYTVMLTATTFKNSGYGRPDPEKPENILINREPDQNR